MSNSATEIRGTSDLERALAASEDRFHAIVDRSTDGILVLTAEGTIRFVNPAAESLLGRSAEELLDQRFEIAFTPRETTEVTVQPRVGDTRTAELRAVETEWQGAAASLVTLHDITDHKLAEQKAAEAVRRRDEFLAMLSHELRNPLAAIANAAEIICRTNPDDERTCPAKEVIDRQRRQMTRLLDDLLDVMRISQRRIPLRLETLDFRSIVAEALDTCLPMLKARGHQLEDSFQEAPVLVRGDSARLTQVVTNLLTNAARYTEGAGRIRVNCTSRDGQAVLMVRDNGIGIPPEMLESIFEPFVQTPQTLARSDAGLGVGLALVRTLIELHGGHVHAHSKGLGCGSEFVLTLPLSDTPIAPTPPKPEPPPVKGLRILVVEDNSDVRDMLATLLKLEGHQVRAVSDGQQALAAVATERPDVALVDIGLPVLDGYQVAQRLRADPATANLRLIALTGYGQSQDRRRALDSGFDTHVTKPVDCTRLLQVIAETVNRRRV